MPSWIWWQTSPCPLRASAPVPSDSRAAWLQRAVHVMMCQAASFPAACACVVRPAAAAAAFFLQVQPYSMQTTRAVRPARWAPCVLLLYTTPLRNALRAAGIMAATGGATPPGCPAGSWPRAACTSWRRCACWRAERVRHTSGPGASGSGPCWLGGFLQQWGFTLLAVGTGWASRGGTAWGSKAPQVPCTPLCGAGWGEAAAASGVASSVRQDLPAPDTLVGVVRFESGAAASVSMSFAGTTPRRSLIATGTQVQRGCGRELPPCIPASKSNGGASVLSWGPPGSH